MPYALVVSQSVWHITTNRERGAVILKALGQSLTVRGQYMYPRHAPLLLTGLIRSGLLSLEPFSIHSFPLEQVNQAVQYARDHGGAFQLTVLKPAGL